MSKQEYAKLTSQTKTITEEDLKRWNELCKREGDRLRGNKSKSNNNTKTKVYEI